MLDFGKHPNGQGMKALEQGDANHNKGYAEIVSSGPKSPNFAISFPLLVQKHIFDVFF